MKLLWQCNHGECENPRMGSLEYCASCAKSLRDIARDLAKPVKPVKSLRRVPVQKISEKRKEQNTEYLAEHDPWLLEHDKCEACGDPSEEVHHKNGRFGERLTDKTYWMAVCKLCHREIHANPEWAREQGFLLIRSV